MAKSIRVLHIDDDPGFADMVGSFLEREDAGFDIVTATNAADGVDRLTDADADFDCIVSDYEMPGKNGIEFLKAVRDHDDEIPFILYTGKGSEEVASDAISNGATDYLQKRSGTEQYELLAHRIRNAVEQYRSNQRRATLERVRALVRDINHTLVRASSRQEIETRVCEILTGADPYRFAVIAAIDAETERIIPKTWAGTGGAFLEEFEMRVAEGTSGRQAPGGRAYHEREIAIAQNIQTDPSYAEWREQALTQGFQSLAVVPLEHDEQLYGLLALFADRPEAFDETEQSVLTELAADIAHAIYTQSVQRELRQKERRYQAIFNDPNILVGLIDPDGTVRDINETAMAYIDATREQVIGIPFWETPWFAHSEAAQADIREWVDRAANGDYVEFELELERPDGDPYAVEGAFRPVRDDEGEVVSLIISDREVTGRKERERELERINARFQALAENFPNGGVHYFDADLRYQYVAGAGFESMATSPDDLEGNTIYEVELYPAEVVDTLESLMHTTLAGNEESLELTFESQIFELRSVPIRDNDGAVMGGFFITQDITEQRRRERNLERQNDQLEQFASIVSHDLRNPLSVAQGRLELALEECDSEHLDSVADALDRSETLVDDILRLSREGNEVTDTDEVNVGIFAEQCWQSVETAEATMTVEADQTIHADRSRLQQLLENLYRNAVEHGGDEVTVTVGEIETGFYVADDGGGIPETDREQVFEPGYSTGTEGTGYGLQIVKQIGTAHGWDVRVSKSAEGGARFEIVGVESVD